MAFHIVTNRCFLACDKVTAIVIEELDEPRKSPVKKKKGKGKTKKVVVKALPEPTFCISISYHPITTSITNRHNGSDQSEMTMEVRINGADRANKLYREIVKEVQEQHPTEAYLNTLVDKLFNEELVSTEKDDD